MNRKLCCVMVVILAGTTAAAFGDPYSTMALDGQLVMIDITNQSIIPIGEPSCRPLALVYSFDGFLYAVEFESGPANLVKMDPATGSAEWVGPLGDIGIFYSLDLAEDANGQLWMLTHDTLYTIDRETGTATVHCEADVERLSGLAFLGHRMVTNVVIGNTNPGCGLENLEATAPFLSTGPDGGLYGLIVAPWGWWSDIVRINPATGEEEVLAHFLGMALIGLACPPEQQPPGKIPTLDWRGFLLLAILLAAAGALTLARVRH
jgi:hypothetical protein